MLEATLKIPRLFDFWLRFNDGFRKTTLKKNFAVNIDDKKVLEIGCGTGNISVIFPQECYTGIDIFPDYIKYAKEKFPGRKFLVMSGSKLDFKSESFDYVLLSCVLHHMDDESCRSMFKECSRILKKNGRIAVLEPEIPPLISWVDYILCLLDRGKNIRTRAGYAKLFSGKFEVEKFLRINPSFWKVPQTINVFFCLKKK